MKRKQPKKESLFLGRLLQKIAKKIGARVYVEPEWGLVGQITFKTGRHSYFRYNTLDLNPVGSSDIAKDKGYATLFMKRLGYPTAPGNTFFSDEWCEAIGSRQNAAAAYRYAKKLGLPVIVKPNSGSQGVGVTLAHTQKEFFLALRAVFKTDRVVLVQRPVAGKDYRIVVLDSDIISAYERIPLCVVGDGRSTIKRLLMNKARGFLATSRDTRINMKDPRMLQKLKRQKLSFASKLKKGDAVYLLDNANLSSGGDSIDVTKHIHPEFRKIAVSLTRDMGLRLCGVDLMIEGDISKRPGKYWVLEINAAPGLDHYVKTGRAQERIVEDLYLRVLKSLDR